MKCWAIALSALMLAAAACGEDEVTLGRDGTEEPDAGTGKDASKAEASASDAPTITPKRSVFTRNPFGNVAATGNLIWDGDFEWFTPFALNYGWCDVSGGVTSSIGYQPYTRVRVSTECRSGMRCGYLTQNQRIAAIGVAPADSANVAGSVWIKVPTELCFDVSVSLISCDYAGDPDVPLTDGDNQPDSSGWCHYQAVSPARQRATCLYIETRFDEGEALVDDATVLPTSVAPTPSTIAPPSSVEAARAAIRKYVRSASPQKSRAREELELWMGRRR